MGAYFSNLHIKGAGLLTEDVKISVVEYFTERGILQTDSETADLEVTVYVPENSDWISVYSDAFAHGDVLTIAPQISEKCDTDVLSAACFDSDCLFLNLINKRESVDAWLNIGKSYEIKAPRRNNITEWRKKVNDFESFKAAAKEKYICAEDFLRAVQSNLALPYEQSTGDNTNGKEYKLFFSSPLNDDISPTDLDIRHYSRSICKPGKREACFVNNIGSASRGILVVFTGSYIENDEITIDDAEFVYHNAKGNFVNIPIMLEKRRLTNGEWVYFWKDPDFKIPPKVSHELPPKVRSDKEHLRSFGIRYTPNGNKRKFLDITVTFIPSSNSADGQCSWFVWNGWESKREFIDWCNKKAEELIRIGAPVEFLDPNDYDLD